MRKRELETKDISLWWCSLQ